MKTKRTLISTTLGPTLLLLFGLLGWGGAASAQTTLASVDFNGSADTYATNFFLSENATPVAYWSPGLGVSGSDGIYPSQSTGGGVSAIYTNQSFDFSTVGRQYIVSAWCQYSGTAPGSGSGRALLQLALVNQTNATIGTTSGSNFVRSVSLAYWWNSWNNPFGDQYGMRAFTQVATGANKDLCAWAKPIQLNYPTYKWMKVNAIFANIGSGRIRIDGWVDGYTDDLSGVLRYHTANPYVMTNADLCANPAVYPGFRNRFNSGRVSALDNFAIAEAPVPQAPTGLTLAVGDNVMIANWNYSQYALGHNLYRAGSPSGPFVQVASLGITNQPNTYVTNANFTTYGDTGLTLGNTYYYCVTATNLAGESLTSTTNSAIYSPPVQGLSAVGGTNQISLSWTPVILLGGATNYVIYRSDAASGPFAAVGTNSTAATSYVDTGLLAGKQYYYYVQGTMNGEVPSGASSVANAFTAAGTPSNVLAEAFTASVLRFGWSTADLIPATTIIEASADGITFSPVGIGTNCTATSGTHWFGNASHFYLTGLTPSTTRYFRAYATNSAGFSPPSVIVGAVTLPVAGININFSDYAFTTFGEWPILGYLDDYGQAHGLRTNGWTYGWDMDKTADARTAGDNRGQDDRYRTLNRMYSTNNWSISVPNGLYLVHIASGDPSSTYSAQYRVQGLETDLQHPDGAYGNWWVDQWITVNVTSGMLTISNGYAVTANRIQFVNIYPTTPMANSIVTQPQSQTLMANAKAEFSVMVGGGPTPYTYQWYSNNVALADATNRTYAIAAVASTDAGSYHVVVANAGASVTSSTAVLTVAPRTAPVLVSAGSMDGSVVGVAFDESMDPTSAQTAANYTVSDGSPTTYSVWQAVLRPDGKTVELSVSPAVTGTFMVAVTNVLDVASNPLAGAVVSGSVLGLTGTTMGNSPTWAGFTDGQSIQVTGGGSDIWNNMDSCGYVYQSVTGDFDARTRIMSLVPGPGYTTIHPIAKAVLMARESISMDSPDILIDVNPPATQALTSPGRDQYSSDLRIATNGATANWGWYYRPGNMPDCWVRLVRTGNEFRPYRSFDGGVTWQQTGLITNAFASEMLIGLGVTSHDNDSGGIVTATGTFQGFTLAPVAPDVAVSAAASLPSLIAGNPLQYTISIVNQGSASASSVSVSDVLPAGVTYVSSWASIGSASESSGTVTWTAGTLAVGQSATLTINVTAAAAGTAVNTATATASGDSNLANNAASTSTTILPQPDVALAKTASVANTIVGSAFSYTLAVTNQGAGNSASVSVSDPLPAGVTYVTNSASAGTVSYSAGTLTWNLGAMASGQAATLTVNVTAATAGSKVNTALATATDDGSPLNNSSSATVTVIQPVQPQLGTPVYSGGTTTFGFSFASQADVPYTIQYATNLVAPIYWQTLQTTNGNGSVIQVLDPSASADPRYYRVIVVP